MKKWIALTLMMVMVLCTACASATTVGICQLVQHEALDAATKGFKDALSAKMPDVKFDEQNASGDAVNCATIVNTFVSNGVDLIMANATAPVQAAVAATADIPILGTSVTDYATALGVTEFTGVSGINVSGTTDLAPLDGQANMVKELFPDAKKVGLLYDKGQDASTGPIKAAKAYLDAAGVEYVEKTGTTNDEVMLAADALIAEDVEAVFTPTDNTIMTAELGIYEKFIDAGIPHYCGADSFALNGAYLGYGVNYATLGKETANMVAEVLVDGKEPASLPVKTLDNGTATVNTETAAALNLDYEKIRDMCDGFVEVQTSEEFE